VQYALAHDVLIEPGGVLERLLGTDRIAVNSLHGQGVNRLAPRLEVEARAPDGLVEAFSVPDAPGFALAVQWHPEWHAAENPVSMHLLHAFGDAARAYRRRADQRDRTSEGIRHAPP
jgi:Predicted glutamine amidotransferases